MRLATAAIRGLLPWKGMHPELTRLQRMDQLEELLRQTESRPLLLFKHSHSCGVSLEALDELIAHLNARLHDIRYAMVTVQTHRDISNAVSAKLGVRHHTPQALLIHNARHRGSCAAGDYRKQGLIPPRFRSSAQHAPSLTPQA
jgi:bacillithiol system protein YtxJ